MSDVEVGMTGRVLPHGRCPEFTEGIGATLLCERDYGHDGPHRCPRTGATWETAPARVQTPDGAS